MKSVLVSLIFISFCATGKSITWFHGSVILQTQEVLTGSVSVDAVHDLVLFQTTDSRVQVFSPGKVASVFFYDPQLDLDRKFISFPAIGQAMRPSLFEEVLNGGISVLRKQFRSSNGRELSDRHDFEYFTRIGAQLSPLSNFSRSIFPLMVREATVRDFVRSNNLDVFELSDAIRIIMHYNKNGGKGLALTRK